MYFDQSLKTSINKWFNFFFTEEIQEKYFKYLQNSKSFRIFKLNESYKVKSQSLTFTWKQNIVDKKALEIVLIVKVNISK